MNDDPSILGGLSSIINRSNVDPSINFEEIERSMLNGGLIDEDLSTNPSDDFKDQLKQLSERIGIKLDDDKSTNKSVDNKFLNKPLFNESFGNSDFGNLSLNNSTLGNTSNNLFGNSSLNNSSFTNSPLGNSSFGNTSNNLFSNPSTDNTLNNIYGDDDDESGSGSGSESSDDDNNNNQSSFGQSNSFNNFGNNFDMKTDEEERKSITQGVISDISNETSSKIFSLEKERREHEKGIKLEKIDELRKTLDSEKIDLTNVPKVNRTSSDEEIDYALKILILKNDRIRFHTVAEEVILLGAYALEEVFDGKREFFGKFRPNLVGWHTHVSSKLRRMRYDTSTLVSNVMSEYNIGSVGRIALELVPNAFMYSRKMKKSYGTETLYTDQQADVARSGIRDKDELF